MNIVMNQMLATSTSSIMHVMTSHWFTVDGANNALALVTYTHSLACTQNKE